MRFKLSLLTISMRLVIEALCHPSRFSRDVPDFRHAVPRPGKTSPGTPNVPDFNFFKMQPKPKMTTTTIITITIIGVIVLI